MYAMLVLYTQKHSVKYMQSLKLLIHNIKGDGLPNTDTDHNEESPPKALVGADTPQCMWHLFYQCMLNYIDKVLWCVPLTPLVHLFSK